MISEREQWGLYTAAVVVCFLGLMYSIQTWPRPHKHRMPEVNVVKADRVDRVPEEEPPPDFDLIIPKQVKTYVVAPLFQPAVSAPKFEPMPTLVSTKPDPQVSALDLKVSAPKVQVASSGDVCARHGMKRKTEGRRWRCVH